MAYVYMSHGLFYTVDLLLLRLIDAAMDNLFAVLGIARSKKMKDPVNTLVITFVHRNFRYTISRGAERRNDLEGSTHSAISIDGV